VRFIKSIGGNLICFENKERESEFTSRELYLRIFASGIVQLLRDLSVIEKSFTLNILVALRVDTKARYEHGEDHIPDEEYQSNLDYFIKLFGVSEILDVQVRTLSLGERMKMELIVALLHNPKILFLDEPTIGLDAVAQKQIRRFLKEVNETKGTTIILTSHYMEDIKLLCKRCVVVNGGVKLFDGDTDTLFAKYQTHKKITLSLEQEETCEINQDCTLLETLPYKVSLLIKKENSQELLKDILSRYELSDITIEEEDIGNIVERIYNDKSGVVA
jgi:ABC-2 type transport system ATP-binding protein